MTDTTTTAAALFGARLRAARRSAGLSKRQAAKLFTSNTSVDVRFFTYWEKSTSYPTSGLWLKDLCTLYDIQPSWLDAEPLRFASDDEALHAFERGTLSRDELKRWFRVERALQKGEVE